MLSHNKTVLTINVITVGQKCTYVYLPEDMKSLFDSLFIHYSNLIKLLNLQSKSLKKNISKVRNKFGFVSNV